MKFPIPTIHTITTIAEALDAGCDAVMLKYDGWPVLINCFGTEGHVLSQLDTKTGRVRTHGDPETLERVDKLQNVEPLSALFVGAKERSNPVIHLYDTWWMDGQDVQHLPYRQRYLLTRTNCKKLDERFVVVPVLPVAAAKTLWAECVREGLKGLVFRSTHDTSAGDLYVIRHYGEMPRELT